MAAGTGKSVIVGLLLGMLQHQFANIVVLYSDRDLLAFERESIEKMKEMIGDNSDKTV